MPETGVDPINIAAHIYLSLQEIIAREIAPTQPAALTIGRFSAGEAPNIIPEDVILEGTIRAMDCKLSLIHISRRQYRLRICPVSKQNSTPHNRPLPQ